MYSTEQELIQLANNMLADFKRASSELAAADRHLRTLFDAMQKGGLVDYRIATGFTPDLHLRAAEVYRSMLAELEEKAGGTQP